MVKIRSLLFGGQGLLHSVLCACAERVDPVGFDSQTDSLSDASPEPGSELLCSHPRKIREEKKFMEASSSLFTRPPRPFRALRVRVYKEAIKHVLGISSVAFLPVTAPLKCG